MGFQRWCSDETTKIYSEHAFQEICLHLSSVYKINNVVVIIILTGTIHIILLHVIDKPKEPELQIVDDPPLAHNTNRRKLYLIFSKTIPSISKKSDHAQLWIRLFSWKHKPNRFNRFRCHVNKIYQRISAS